MGSSESRYPGARRAAEGVLFPLIVLGLGALVALVLDVRTDVAVIKTEISYIKAQLPVPSHRPLRLGVLPARIAP